MLIKTKNKMDFIESYIKTWVKDPKRYCNNCGASFDGIIACCEDPYIVNNATVMQLIVKQNKMLRETRKDEYGSFADKSMRGKISLPPKLYMDLERKLNADYEEKLFKTTKEQNDFMRRFPYLTISERV